MRAAAWILAIAVAGLSLLALLRGKLLLGILLLIIALLLGPSSIGIFRAEPLGRHVKTAQH